MQAKILSFHLFLSNANVLVLLVKADFIVHEYEWTDLTWLKLFGTEPCSSYIF